MGTQIFRWVFGYALVGLILSFFVMQRTMRIQRKVGRIIRVSEELMMPFGVFLLSICVSIWVSVIFTGGGKDLGEFFIVFKRSSWIFTIVWSGFVFWLINDVKSKLNKESPV